MTDLKTILWTDAEVACAKAEGWDLVEIEAPGLKQWDIQRDEQSERFTSDADAVHHVFHQAMQGSELHTRAIKVAMSTAIGFKPIRVGLNLSGGLVQAAWATEPVDITTVDYEVDSQDDEVCEVEQPDNGSAEAYVYRFGADLDPFSFARLDKALATKEQEQEPLEEQAA